MASSTRIKGNKLSLKFGAVEMMADTTKCFLNNEAADADVTTFEEAGLGGARQWFFEITALQSVAASSFWDTIWNGTGTTVTYTYAPFGNATPTVAQPHFTGSVTIGPKPPIGGEAGATKTFTFDYRLDCTAEPTRKTV